MATAELLINVMASAGQASSVIGELQMQTRQLEQIMANTGKTVTSTAAKTEESTGMFGKLGNEFSKIGSMAIGMATGMLAANVSMGIAERVASAATEIDEYGKAVLRVQRITGESAEGSSSIVALFERFTPDPAAAITRITRFQRALAGQEDALDVAAPGGKTTGAYLREFGVSSELAASQTTPFTEKLKALAEGFKNSSDEQQKSAASIALFGRGSDSMIRLLNQGRDGIEQVIAMSKKYGLTLTGENLQDVVQFGLAHKDLDMALQGVSIQLGAAFMPAITSAAKATATLGQNLNQSVLPTIKALGESSATPAILAMASGLTLLAGAVKIGAVVMSGIAGVFVMLGGAIYIASEPLRRAIEMLYTLKAAYADLTPAQLAVPGVQGLADVINKLPGTSINDLLPKGDAGSEGAETELPSDTTPGNVKAATKEADAAKTILQAQQNAAAERKAQFDLDSLNNTTTLLNLKAQEVDANQALVGFKREMEDIDRSAVNFAEQRLKLEEQRAVLLAQQAAGPLKNQSEDIQFQENLIKAQIKAARAGGAPVDTGALRQHLHALQREGTVLEPSLLIAEHNVSLADRTKSATDLTSSLTQNATDQRKLGVTEAMQPAQDAATAAKRQMEDQQHIVDLEKQTFDLKEQGFQAELLIAMMRDKSATAAQLLVQHPDQFPVYGPAPVGSPAEAGAAAGAEAGAAQAPVIGDITVTAGVGTTLDDVLQAVAAKLAERWQAAMQGTPVVGSLGGAFQGSSGGSGGFG